MIKKPTLESLRQPRTWWKVVKSCFSPGRCTDNCIINSKSIWDKLSMSWLQETWRENRGSQCTVTKEAAPQKQEIRTSCYPPLAGPRISQSTPPASPGEGWVVWGYRGPADIQGSLVPGRSSGLQKHKTLLLRKSHTWVRSCPAGTLTQALSPKKKQSGDEGVRDEEWGSNRDVVLW